MKQIQQGDVLLKGIKELPEGVKLVKRVKGILTVMHGESGHNHTIAEKGARLLELDGNLYLEVLEPVAITHEEHKALPIPEGIYTIGRVKEYDYFQQSERFVVD